MALTATDLFNDATTREIGGVGPDQVNLIVSDLIGVQQMLAAAVPQINNLSDLHTQVIINQLNEEIASVENANSPTGTLILGTDLGQFVGRAINDIHRDIIDIAQGDAGVQALFNPTPLPALNTPACAVPRQRGPDGFRDPMDPGQQPSRADGDHDREQWLHRRHRRTGPADPDLRHQFERVRPGARRAVVGAVLERIPDRRHSGTAAAALIDGLQNHNAGEVNAAVEQLAANSGDVGTNNLMADGGSLCRRGSRGAGHRRDAERPQRPRSCRRSAPAAAEAPAAAAAPAAGLTATDLFNDATTREIGGVGPDQVNLIVSDLIGVQQMLTAAVPQINNLSDLHTQVIINQLNEEIASVENANSPTGTLMLGTDLGQFVGRAINDIHRDIIDIAQGDAGVQALFNPTPLPALNTPACAVP